MAKIIFQDEQGQNLNWYRLVAVEGQTDVYALERVATITQQGTPYNKEIGDHFLQVEDGTPVQTLSCTKTGTAYALTGLTATSGKVVCVFQADSAYSAGDTFTVDDVSYSIVTNNGAALGNGVFTAGATLAVVLDIDNQKINIKGDPVIPTALKNPNALIFAVGNGGTADTYDGSAAKTVSIPKVTLSTTATPSYTLAPGELYFSPN